MLDACDWVLESAVNLYLSVGEGGGGGNGQAAAQHNNGNSNRTSGGPAGWPQPSNPTHGAGGGGGRDGGRGTVSDNGGHPGRHIDDAGDYMGDARGHSAHGYQGGDESRGFHEEEEVRAVIPARTERLYDPVGAGHYSPQDFAAMLASRQTQNRGPPEAIVDAFGDFKSEGAEAGGSGGSADSNRLSGMFKAPGELLFKGSFEQAKLVGVGDKVL